MEEKQGGVLKRARSCYLTYCLFEFGTFPGLCLPICKMGSEHLFTFYVYMLSSARTQVLTSLRQLA
jgi:hypothetical protein